MKKQDKCRDTVCREYPQDRHHCANSYNNKTGITLIALVITIIILLILAGITINLTIGQRGILRRAEEAGRNYTNSAKQEETILKEILDVKEEKWVLADTYTSPNYPENYPNNSNLNVKKVYDESVKLIRIVFKDVQVEGGCQYDYMLIKDANDNVLQRVCDGADFNYIIKGNILNFSFISDGSVTRRGFDMDIYLCREEEEYEQGIYFSLRDIVLNDDQQKIEQKNFRNINSQNEVCWKAYRYNGNSLDNENEINAFLTILSIDGKVLYSKEIHDREEFVVDISKFPEFFIINLERKSTEQYTIIIKQT